MNSEGDDFFIKIIQREINRSKNKKKIKNKHMFYCTFICETVDKLR